MSCSRGRGGERIMPRGFWSDPDGWSLADVVTILVLPVWIYVAVKFALARDLSANQVDYFLILSYPLLIAVGGKALSSLPLPWPRRSGLSVAPQQEYYNQQYQEAAQKGGNENEPTI